MYSAATPCHTRRRGDQGVSPNDRWQPIATSSPNAIIQSDSSSHPPLVGHHNSLCEGSMLDFVICNALGEARCKLMMMA